MCHKKVLLYKGLISGSSQISASRLPAYEYRYIQVHIIGNLYHRPFCQFVRNVLADEMKSVFAGYSQLYVYEIVFIFKTFIQH